MQTIDTRERILEQMFLDIRKNGFQGLRADKVIAGLQITKGALYHYFDNKQAIGRAVIDEIIRPNYLRFYQELDRWEGDPIVKLQEHLQFLSGNATDEEVALGCPLNNLVQEMSPLDEDFRLRMKSIIDHIHTSVSAALARSKSAGLLRADFDPAQIAQFYFAGIEGAYAIAKVRKDAAAFKSNMQLLGQFLESLRVS
jgi:TetR/AcrR family transcriptional regulator, transcriptional repressor for nem operon